MVKYNVETKAENMTSEIKKTNKIKAPRSESALIQIFDQRANYEESMKLLKEKNLNPLTYQQALVEIDKDAELKEKLKDKWFYLEGKGLEESGYYTFDNKGELKAGKGDIEKIVYCWSGDNPLTLGVHTDDFARAYERRYFLYAHFDPQFVAPVVVGIRLPTTRKIYTNGVDMLREIFDHQETLQLRLGGDIHSQRFCTEMATALMVETSEFLQETPWKSWKKSAKLNRENAKDELADILHFFVNLCLFMDIMPEELLELYLRKNKVNHERQDEGY